MSVVQTDKIDFAHLDPKTDDVILTITDHLNWTDEPSQHLFLLQEKLNAYLRFVESKEVYATMPVTIGRKIRFRVVGKFPLNSEAKMFYSAATKKLVSAGFDLSFEHRDLDGFA